MSEEIPPSTSKRFTIPWRNHEGILVWELIGERAKFRPDGHKEIEDVVVNMYQGANIDWTMSTPACILNNQSNEAISEADVRIFNKRTEITGTGFHLLFNESRLIIRNHVQVIIHGGLTKEVL